MDEPSSAPGSSSEPGKVCLSRNLPAGAAGGGVEGEDAALVALAGVHMVNGLECKLCSAQQKVKKVRGGAGEEGIWEAGSDGRPWGLGGWSILLALPALALHLPFSAPASAAQA